MAAARPAFPCSQRSTSSTAWVMTTLGTTTPSFDRRTGRATVQHPSSTLGASMAFHTNSRCSTVRACSRLSCFCLEFSRAREARGRCYQVLPRGCADECKRAPTGAPARAENACKKQKTRQESQIEVEHSASSTSWGHWFEPSTAHRKALEIGAFCFL